MIGQTSVLKSSASLPLHFEANQTGDMPQDAASGRGSRLLWTGFGFAFLMVIGISARVLGPLSPDAAAKPSRLAPEVATMSFEPPISMLDATSGRGGAKASSPAANPDAQFRNPSRRTVLATIGVAAASAAISQPALADPPPVTASYNLKKDYPTDAKQMLDNMKFATDMTRGTPGMEDTVKKTRSEMNDFVAFYRRQPKVAGMPSFSTMYTAINTLSGHYASYGNKYPVPEKRKVRLQQQYKEIDRALARGK